MGGFTDWVEQVADSKSARDYRSRVSDAESGVMGIEPNHEWSVFAPFASG
jgi:hypothetical protein